MTYTASKFAPADLQPKYKVSRYVKCALCDSHVAPNRASNEKFCGKVVTVCFICSGK